MNETAINMAWILVCQENVVWIFDVRWGRVWREVGGKKKKKGMNSLKEIAFVLRVYNDEAS